MEEQIEVSVDSQDCIRIPAEIQNRLGLSPGITLVVEEREKGEICLRVQKEIPELVDKYGVLVVKSEATGDLAEAVEHEHGRHARKQRSKSSLDELPGNRIVWAWRHAHDLHC